MAQCYARVCLKLSHLYYIRVASKRLVRMPAYQLGTVKALLKGDPLIEDHEMSRLDPGPCSSKRDGHSEVRSSCFTERDARAWPGVRVGSLLKHCWPRAAFPIWPAQAHRSCRETVLNQGAVLDACQKAAILPRLQNELVHIGSFFVNEEGFDPPAALLTHKDSVSGDQLNRLSCCALL